MRLLLASLLLLRGCYTTTFEFDDDDVTDDDDFGDDDDVADDDDSADDDDDSTAAPDSDGDGWPDDEDCAPLDPNTYPGAPEVCDGQDQDCDGLPDDGLLGLWFVDADLDGWGAIGSGVETCDPDPAWITQGQDCDDADPNINPASTQQVDGQDSDCDGAADWLVSIYISVDGDFEWCVDDELTLTPGNSSWPVGIAVQQWLPSGPHVVGIRGWDTGQVITAGIAHIEISTGQQWLSDDTWRWDPNPSAPEGSRVGWCGVGFDDTTWQPANEIGPIGSNPWGNAPSSFPTGSGALWIWDTYPVNLNTQFLRKLLVLP